MLEKIGISMELSLMESAKFRRIQTKLGVKARSEVVRHLLATYVEDVD